MKKFKCTGFSNSNRNHPAKDILGKEIYLVVEPRVGSRAVFQIVDEEAAISTSTVDRIIPCEREPRAIIFFTRNSLYVFEATECSFCDGGAALFPTIGTDTDTYLKLEGKKLMITGAPYTFDDGMSYTDAYTIDFCPRCGKSTEGEQP